MSGRLVIGANQSSNGRRVVGKRIGKVKWFSAQRNSGVLTTIAGTELRFTCPDGTRAAAALAPGQMVSYEVVEDGLSSNEVRAEPVAHVRLERRRLGGRRADDQNPADRSPRG